MDNTKNWHEKHKEELSFGSRLADSVASGMGSWKFIISSNCFGSIMDGIKPCCLYLSLGCLSFYIT